MAFSKTQISNFVQQATDKVKARQILVERSKANKPRSASPDLKTSNITLMSRSELAAQFLPDSVK